MRPERTQPGAVAEPAEPVLAAEAQRQVEAYIEEEEGATHRFTGTLAALATTLLLAMSLFHLYAAVSIVPTQTLRPVHTGFMLVAAFFLFPMLKCFRGRSRWHDLLAIALSLFVVAYPIMGGDDFNDRNTDPSTLDLAAGGLFLLLILEAARRTTGRIMPALTVAFLAYAVAGPWLPSPWTHRGYDLVRIVGHMYMTLEGVFGPAVDVSATLIILFTIYGAVLQASGAGRFFLDLSFALMGRARAGVGRTVVLSSFLLGGPSGSGVATTVTMGTVAWPMMRKAGYDPAAAGGLLAAGGLGAILSPPVLGAAAFLIAEFLKISYLEVIAMAVVPTVLYYASLFLMVELDARRLPAPVIVEGPSAWALLKRQGHHLVSLVAVVAFMMVGYSPALSVVWTIGLAIAMSWLRPESAMGPRRIVQALSDGSLQMINVAATCALAGVIVGVVTLTGLGLKLSSIIIELAGGSLVLTALYSGVIVGLAVPVTASYIICAVIVAPAMIKLGVPDFAAHMFVFYYAVLSEVSPPTALSPFAAAAITGADPMRTTLQSWKYTLPAFVVPLAFVMEPAGQGLLLHGNLSAILIASGTALVGIAALAAGAQGRVVGDATRLERAGFVVGGLALVYPAANSDAVGAVLSAGCLLIHMLRLRRKPQPSTPTL
jgi:TRAP transporter 4TM/12TM fusion protein